MNGAAVFLDKDGTLIHDVPYNIDPERIMLMPGAAEGLEQLHAAGFQLIVITNQAGVAYGYFEEAALSRVEKRLRDLMDEIGVPLTGFYYCPHHPQATVEEYRRPCPCRKPDCGLLLEAADDHGLDLSRCWMVGDILNDIEAGNTAGCRTVLIDNGSETEWIRSPIRTPTLIAVDLAEAAARIVNESFARSSVEASSFSNAIRGNQHISS